MAEPTFLGDGNTPRRHDALWAIEQKILGAIRGGGGGGGGLTGIGSPEGSVTANAGTTYLDTSNNFFYAKGSGSGNTGWVALIQ